MPDTAETISTYSAAWGEPDAERRRELLERCWAADGVYSDPLSLAEGREALDNLIGGFQAANPGATFPLASGLDEHHGFVRFQWRMVDAGGTVTIEGFDIGELGPDGRLRRITGFFGPFPQLPS